MPAGLFFSTFDVTRQVFFRSKLSFAVVNLKPIVPGHVLVVPRRVVPRVSDLTTEEVSDLFRTVQTIGKMVEKAFEAESATIACQDGPAAGQSVPHVHVHILPRKWVDFGGRNDDVYPAIEVHEAGLPADLQKSDRRIQSLRVDNEDRPARTLEDMEKEATWLSSLFSSDDK